MRNLKINFDRRGSKKLAIMLHVFYIDSFLNSLPFFASINSADVKLYVTAPIEIIPLLNKQLSLLDLDYEIYNVENKGRDILPFLQILPIINKNQHEIILKLHTKKSKHLNNGDIWNSFLYNHLIAIDVFSKNIQRFESDITLGIWAPSGCWAPMRQNWTANKSKVLTLSKKLGFQPFEVSNLPFAAGTMFFARVDALMPLLNIGLTEADFELESGQLDGTLAHAIERVITLSVIYSGFRLPENASKNSISFGQNLYSSLTLQEKLKRSYRHGGLIQIFADSVQKAKKMLASLKKN